MKTAILGSVVMIVLSFSLTALFGIWGICIALLLVQFSSAGYFLFSYTKMLNRRLASFFPLKRLLVIAFISIACAATIGVLLEPLIHLSGATAFLSSGTKLAFLFSCDVGIYVLFLFITRIVKLDQVLVVFKKLANNQV
jgi:hypothetical protein